MLHAVGLWIALYAVWLLLSGYFTPFLMTLGAVSTTVVVAIAIRMDVVDREAVPLHLGWRIAAYWPWLIWEIVKANVDVTRRILRPSLPISPTLIKVRANQKTELCQVIFANSITLTPGTVSIDVDQGVITVHALSEAAALAIEDGAMNRRVAAVEGAG